MNILIKIIIYIAAAILLAYSILSAMILILTVADWIRESVQKLRNKKRKK